MAFVNDQRNIGGRDFIKSHMINHRATLLNIKSTIKIVPPKDHVDKFKEKKSTSKDFLSHQRYSMVRATYNTIYNMKKGITDSNLPYTYGFLNNIKGRYKNKLSNFITEEHLKNVESFIKRQQSIGNKTDRKKNPYDPYVYPALFFRNKNDLIQYVPVTFNKTQNIKSAANPLQVGFPSISLMNSKNINIYNPTCRPTTARVYGQNIENETGFNAISNNQWMKAVTDPSKLLYQKYYHNLSAKGDIYKDVKKEAIDFIVDNRYYKNDELEKVFSQMFSKYSHLDINRLQLIKDEILRDLTS